MNEKCNGACIMKASDTIVRSLLLLPGTCSVGRQFLVHIMC